MAETRTAATMFDNATATDVHGYIEHPGKGCKLCGRTMGTKLHREGSALYLAALKAEILAKREAQA